MIKKETAVEYAKKLLEYVNEAYNECCEQQEICGKVDACGGCRVYEKYGNVLINHSRHYRELTAIISDLGGDDGRD